jgi:alpha-methylacyl-CoA racemase
MNMRPLEGICVLDFSTLLPGPLATLLLAEAGAEVIKIERPGIGDEMRTFTPKWGDDSANFALLNRGKKSVTLDLKSEQDRAKLDPLIARADIIVEQFRPGVMARLKLDYESISVANPRIVYCSITGYGQTGPARDVAGHDLNYIGDTGLLALGFGDLERPVIPPVLTADIAGGTYPAVMNILMALLARNVTGRGSYLDISMADNLFPLMYWALANTQVGDKKPGNGTDLVTGGSPRYRLYPTNDGRLVAAAPIEQRFWNEFCDAIALDANLRDDAKDPEATGRRIAEIIASADATHWKAVFGARDAAASIVLTLDEALRHPQFAARGIFSHQLSNGQGQLMPALPVPIAKGFRASADTAIAAPQLGSHNRGLDR